MTVIYSNNDLPEIFEKRPSKIFVKRMPKIFKKCLKCDYKKYLKKTVKIVRKRLSEQFENDANFFEKSPNLSPGQDFLHSCRHLLGLHLSSLTMAIRVRVSPVSSLRLVLGGIVSVSSASRLYNNDDGWLELDWRMCSSHTRVRIES